MTHSQRSQGMGTQQLLDALTDHIALYHRKSSLVEKYTKGSLCDKVLQWFLGLSIDQRCSILTISDAAWVAVLLNMKRRLEKDGPGYFFILPDVLESGHSVIGSARPVKHISRTPMADEWEQKGNSRKARKFQKLRKKSVTSGSSASASSCTQKADHGSSVVSLPGLCFRKAKGLFARLDDENAAGEVLCKNLQLFSSSEAMEGSSSVLDTVSLSEDVVENAHHFFNIMDGITRQEFFSSFRPGDEDTSWEELPWLKSMGYYTMPAFVVNKIELVLRSAWLHEEGTCRPPRNLAKEFRKLGHFVKAHSDEVSALTVCKRNRNFRDWWMSLADDAKTKLLQVVVAKTVKAEVLETVRSSHSALKSGSSRSWNKVTGAAQFPEREFSQAIAQPTESQYHLGAYIAGLSALEELVSSSLGTVLGYGAHGAQVANCTWHLCSSLDSIETRADNVMRKTRNALQKIMLKSMELDLLKNEGTGTKVPSNDIQGKTKKESRRKKSKNIVQNKAGKSDIASTTVGTLVAEEEKQKKILSSVSNKEKQQEGAEVKYINESSTLSKKKKRARIRTKNLQDSPSTTTCLGNIEDDRNSGLLKACEKDGEIRLLGFSHGGCLDKPLTDSPEVKPWHPFDGQMDKGLVTSPGDCNCVEKTASCLLEMQDYDHPTTDSCVPSREGSRPLDSPSDVDSFDNGMGKLALRKLGPGYAGKEAASSEQEGDSKNNADEQMVSSQRPLTRAGAFGFSQDSGSMEDALRVPAEQSTPMDCGNDVLCSPQLHAKWGPCSHTPMPHLSKSPSVSHVSQERYSDGMRTSSSNPSFGMRTAHEWPGTFQVRFSRGRSHVLSPATERLHLDVGRNWHQPLIALRNPFLKQQLGPLPNSIRSGMQMNFKTSDCPLMFSPGFAQTRSYAFGFREEASIPSLPQSSFPLAYAVPELSSLARGQEDLTHDDRTPDDTDYDDSNYFSGDIEEHEGYMISEEENERQFLDWNRQGEGDYNQYFGGGVMFWNTADYGGTGYSRPPSLSSEDSSWARHEADLSAVLDDIMGINPKSGAYSSVASPGIVSTSPPPAIYRPGFEHNSVNTNTRVSISMSGNEYGKFSPLPPVVPVKSEEEQVTSPSEMRAVDTIALENLPRPLLRPIIVVRDPSLGRQVSGSEGKRHHEAGSPHISRGRRELVWQRRPPSPVLRCVPPSPPPPPPSPVMGFGKRKGLTTARSGSSSPRRWGLVNAHLKEEQDVPFVLSEVLESAWGKRNMREKASIHSIPGTIFRERVLTIPPLAVDKDHPDIALPMQTTLLFNSNPSLQSAITKLHNLLHEEIEGFCKQVATENLLRKAFISTAVDKVAHAMQVLWPRSRLKIFGSNATGLALPCSDVDLVVCLPPVRNLEPIKEAGILEGRNGIKETSLQHAARYLADQDWVKSDTLKTIENTTIPIIMLVAHVAPHVTDSGYSSNEMHASIEKIISTEQRKGPWGGDLDREFIRLDISFEAPSHTGLRTAELVRELTAQFPAIIPLALVLKQFLTDRSLDHPYTGGLSSYCLVILITRFLQHQHHLGWPFQQNLGSLLMDFLYFFGCVFDPRRMGICIRKGGMYISRDRGHSIDPLHIEDPLYPPNNVGRNCFRILQCVKAFADAYSYMEKALVDFADGTSNAEGFRILQNILPSTESLELLSRPS